MSAEYDNSSVGEEEHFEMRHIWETLLDWQVWLHILIYMSIIAPRKPLPYSVYSLLKDGLCAQCTESPCSCRELLAFTVLIVFGY